MNRLRLLQAIRSGRAGREGRARVRLAPISVIRVSEELAWKRTFARLSALGRMNWR